MKKKWVAFGLYLLFLLTTGCKGKQKDKASEEEASSEVVSAEEYSRIFREESAVESGQEVSAEASQNALVSEQQDQSVSSAEEPEPQKVVVQVTIPEGYTFMQIASLLEQKGICSKADFYRTSQNYQVQSFEVPSTSDRCFKMEGFLFPDTYQFYQNDDPERVLRTMLNNYSAKTGCPPQQTLILASIIEQEARSEEHMKLVSSVYHNRINAGMRLDADPTRDYVNEFITGNPLLSDTGRFAALYNTYKCQIPVGPICNPGMRAISAAQNPASTNYYYFFFGNDNQNHYSQTYEEHQAQIAKYGVQHQ